MNRIEQSLAKLNARVKPLADAPQGLADAQQASPPSPPLATSLQWLDPKKTGPGTASQHDTTYAYRLDAVKTKTTLEFTVWALGTAPGRLNERLGCVTDGPAARALCEAHAQSR